MTQELHYTSLPRGLKPGSQGFCTVAATRGMPGPLVERLESLSGYRPLYPPNDPKADRNPPVYSHYRLSLGGKTYSIVSRIGFAGLDYTNRANKYAHHVVLSDGERPRGGPAWLMRQPGFLESSWSGEPRLLPDGRPVPMGDRPPAVCERWGNRTGDPGWAGVVAEALLGPDRRTVFLVVDPAEDALALVEESLALIPPADRWNVGFSTWFTTVPAGLNCDLRVVLKGSPEVLHARRVPRALILDLTSPLGPASGGRLAEAARTGVVPAGGAMPPLLRPSVRSHVGASATPNPSPSPLPTPQTPSEPVYSVGPPVLVRNAVRSPVQKTANAPVQQTRNDPQGKRWTFILLGSLAIALIGVGTYSATRLYLGKGRFQGSKRTLAMDPNRSALGRQTYSHNDSGAEAPEEKPKAASDESNDSVASAPTTPAAGHGEVPDPNPPQALPALSPPPATDGADPQGSSGQQPGTGNNNPPNNQEETNSPEQTNPPTLNPSVGYTLTEKIPDWNPTENKDVMLTIEGLQTRKIEKVEYIPVHVSALKLTSRTIDNENGAGIQISVNSEVGTSDCLATMTAKEGRLRFRWERVPSPSDVEKLSSAVLRLTLDKGEIAYCILRKRLETAEPITWSSDERKIDEKKTPSIEIEIPWKDLRAFEGNVLVKEARLETGLTTLAFERQPGVKVVDLIATPDKKLAKVISDFGIKTIGVKAGVANDVTGKSQNVRNLLIYLITTKTLDPQIEELPKEFTFNERDFISELTKRLNDTQKEIEKLERDPRSPPNKLEETRNKQRILEALQEMKLHASLCIEIPANNGQPIAQNNVVTIEIARLGNPTLEAEKEGSKESTNPH